MRSSDQAKERPYSREELKSVRRADLQSLFKVHGLKGANATTSVLIESLVEYFASPTYLSAHPPPATLASEKEKEKEKDKSISLAATRPTSRAGVTSVIELGASQKSGKGGVPKSKNGVPAGKPTKGRAVPAAPTVAARVPKNDRPASAASNKVASEIKRPASRAGAGAGTAGGNIAAPGGVAGPSKKGGEASGEALSGQRNGSASAASTSTSTSASASINPPKQPATVSQVPTPPGSASSSHTTAQLTLPQVEALLRTNDEKWQARLEMLERNLNEQVEKLRSEMEQIRSQYEAVMRAGSAGPAAPAGHAAIAIGSQDAPNGSRTWSPWENRSVSGPAGMQGQLGGTPSSSSLPFSILGKRRHPDPAITTPAVSSNAGNPVTGDLIERSGGEAKRVRYLNGTRPGDNTPSTEAPPGSANSVSTTGPASAGVSGPPKTPSPQKASTAFGADYFSRPGLPVTSGAAAGSLAGGESSLIPRTPSPSRQGTVPDNSQTPRLPADWQVDDEEDNQMQAQDSDSDSDIEMQDHSTPGRKIRGGIDRYGRTPEGVNMVPQFSTTPEPPHRPISPTVDLERSMSAASSDRLTPGRMIMSTPSNPPSSISMTGGAQLHDDRRAGSEGIPLSTVTDLERIEESEEYIGPAAAGSASTSNRSLISPGGQLRFPTIKPTPRLSGLGVPGSGSMGPGSKTPHQRTPSLLGPPALISRDRTPSSSSAPRVRAGSELPSTSHSSSLRIPSRGLSPPPRPRSANAIHGASTPPRSALHLPFALNLPDPLDDIIGTAGGARVRSASADYMHVAMHGLEEEDDLDFEDASGLNTQTNLGPGSGPINTPRRSARAASASASIPGHGIGVGITNLRTPGRGVNAGAGLGGGRGGRGIGMGRREMPTPGHRTLLGTERYNDKRFGDIPVGFGMGMSLEGGYGYGGAASGIWESPGGPTAGTGTGTGPQTPM
ncbi:hypothetical protein IAT40_005788 [Kwoniella sp. CBS 6097]